MESWSQLRIADALRDSKVITEFQYQDVLRAHRETGTRITHIILQKRIANRTKINVTLAQLGVNDLESYLIDTELLEKFREDQVKKHMVIPLFAVGSKVYVSLADPSDIEAQQMVGFASGFTQIRSIEASPDDVRNLVNKHFSRREAINQAMREMQNSQVKGETAVEDRRFITQAVSQSEAPIVKLVDDYLTRALEENASDVHFEPQEDGLRIRMRIDGHLQTIETVPVTLIGSVTSRIKIMSQMKIDLRMVPQDGRFSRAINNQEIDFRASSFPGIFGESLVIRLLKRRFLIPMESLGLSPEILKRFESALRSDRGIFLVTGPTGCGKTTTLVSILNEIRDPTKKTVTLENPVEYQIDGIVQGQIHPQAGFTWAKGLRAILRHDPNIIMVAEIRDQETASIATEAGLTGHFVLSTLHTNNAPGAIVRLLEMGVEPYLIASSLIGVLAQRLVRVICPKCKQEYSPTPELTATLGIKEIPSGLKLYRGTGCRECRHTGYHGRTGIFELMLVTEKMRQMILRNAGTAEIEIEARKNGMKTLREDGIRKSLRGLTSLEEILSATQDHTM
ncbi:type II/IV secretion system protein [bacterium]|nr:type II/IV secretion system protein [candidate division CSSED10-310 bacterium]